jgi:hypothetical protein
MIENQAILRIVFLSVVRRNEGVSIIGLSDIVGFQTWALQAVANEWGLLN